MSVQGDTVSFCASIEKKEQWILTLESIHRRGGKRTLLSIVGNQLGHPPLRTPNVSPGYYNKEATHNNTYAMVNGTQLPPMDDTM